MDERFNKIDEKLDRMEEHQMEIKADLRYHIKRTDMLEETALPAVKFVNASKAVLKFLLACLAAVAAWVSITSAEARPTSIDTILNAIQKEVPCKIRVHSGYRSVWKNRKVGGAPNSYHLYDRARDISASCMSMKSLGKVARKYAQGVIVYKGHVHIDNRKFPYHKEK